MRKLLRIGHVVFTEILFLPFMILGFIISVLIYSTYCIMKKRDFIKEIREVWTLVLLTKIRQLRFFINYGPKGTFEDLLKEIKS